MTILQESLIARKISELCMVVGDWEKITYAPLKKQAEQEILVRARELVDVVDEVNAPSKPQKSEMPCNCKPKTLQEIIDEAKAELTDSKTFAAVVFRID